MKTKDFYINSIETMLRGTSSSTVEATYKAVRALTQKDQRRNNDGLQKRNNRNLEEHHK